MSTLPLNQFVVSILDLCLDDVCKIIGRSTVRTYSSVYNRPLTRDLIVFHKTIDRLKYAESAVYRPCDGGVCLEGTQEETLGDIKRWVKDFDKPSIYWLNGSPGTGKSTIARTIASELGMLSASFFYPRDTKDWIEYTRSFLFPTLAVQLAHDEPVFQRHLVELICKAEASGAHPANQSLENQLNNFILKPLQSSKISAVIVIDALDEFWGMGRIPKLVTVFLDSLSQIRDARLKILITSRQKPRIEPTLAQIHVLRLAVDKDIRQFLEHEISKRDLKRRQREDTLVGWPEEEEPVDWPAKKDLDKLCRRAAGLFIYALDIVEFMDCMLYSPRERMDLLLGSQNWLVGGLEERATICSCYIATLKELCSNWDGKNDEPIRSFLGAVILAPTPISPSTLGMLLERKYCIEVFLSIFEPILIQEDNEGPVRLFHTSLSAFLTDVNLCPERFHVSAPTYHKEFLIRCLELMDQKLQGDILGPVTNGRGKSLDDPLKYACISWHKHLSGTGQMDNATVSDITRHLHHFLRNNFSSWQRALNDLGTAEGVGNVLQELKEWSQQVRLVRH